MRELVRAVIIMVVLPVVTGILISLAFHWREESKAIKEREWLWSIFEQYSYMEDGAPALGNPNAPLTIELFADFKCPHCRRFYKSAWNKILEDYVVTGKVKIIYRYVPFGAISTRAMLAAMCAAEKGVDEFWKMEDMYYKHGASIRDEADIYKLAAKLGLPTSELQQCVTEKSKHLNQYIQEAEKWLTKYGVAGTPTFVIDGKKYAGAMPYFRFKKILEEHLANIE